MRPSLSIVLSFLLGALLSAVVAYTLRPSKYARLYSVTGEVSHLPDAETFGFLADPGQGEIPGGYPIRYEPPGVELLEVGARVRLLVLIAPRIRDIVISIEPAGSS